MRTSYDLPATQQGAQVGESIPGAPRLAKSGRMLSGRASRPGAADRVHCSPAGHDPERRGNAIYTLIEQLAERSPGDVLALCRWPETGVPAACRLSDRILYDTTPLRATWLERCCRTE